MSANLLNHQPETRRPLGLRHRTLCIVAAALLLAAFSAGKAINASRAYSAAPAFAGGAMSSDETPASEVVSTRQIAGAAIYTGLDYRTTNKPDALPATELVPIEQIQVGERVLAESPTAEEDLQFGADIIPSQWRKLTLSAPKRDGTVADVVLLRPLTWLSEQQGQVGGTVFISVPECGIDGNARVLEIKACPEIADGPGRVVTGTFLQQARSTITLTIAGQTEPIECTGNHPFWSEDRQTFVRADSLQTKETLRTVTGLTTVESTTQHLNTKPVYNIEVHGTHVYHVGTNGLLVHNGGGLPCPDEASFNPLLKTKANFVQQKITELFERNKWLSKRLDAARSRLDDLKSDLPTNAIDSMGFAGFKQDRIQSLLEAIESIEDELLKNRNLIDELL